MIKWSQEERRTGRLSIGLPDDGLWNGTCDVCASTLAGVPTEGRGRAAAWHEAQGHHVAAARRARAVQVPQVEEGTSMAERSAMASEANADLLARARATMINIVNGWGDGPIAQAKAWLDDDRERLPRAAQPGEMTVPAAQEHCCGTCGEWARNGGSCSGFGMAGHDAIDAGPSWDNCRFWKPKE